MKIIEKIIDGIGTLSRNTPIIITDYPDDKIFVELKDIAAARYMEYIEVLMVQLNDCELRELLYGMPGHPSTFLDGTKLINFRMKKSMSLTTLIPFLMNNNHIVCLTFEADTDDSVIENFDMAIINRCIILDYNSTL